MVGRLGPEGDKRYGSGSYRGVYSSLQLDILPHPDFLNLDFLPQNFRPHLIFSQQLYYYGEDDIASTFPFSRYILPHSHDIPFPFSQLDILPQQT